MSCGARAALNSGLSGAFLPPTCVAYKTLGCSTPAWSLVPIQTSRIFPRSPLLTRHIISVHCIVQYHILFRLLSYTLDNASLPTRSRLARDSRPCASCAYHPAPTSPRAGLGRHWSASTASRPTWKGPMDIRQILQYVPCCACTLIAKLSCETKQLTRESPQTRTINSERR